MRKTWVAVYLSFFSSIELYARIHLVIYQSFVILLRTWPSSNIFWLLNDGFIATWYGSHKQSLCPVKYVRMFIQNRLDWKNRPLEKFHTCAKKILRNHEQEGEKWTSRKWKKIITLDRINFLRLFFLLSVYQPTTHVWDTRVQFSSRCSNVGLNIQSAPSKSA